MATGEKRKLDSAGVSVELTLVSKGQSWGVTAPAAATVLQLKEHIYMADRTKLPAERQRFVCRGKTLDDARSLGAQSRSAANLDLIPS